MCRCFWRGDPPSCFFFCAWDGHRVALHYGIEKAPRVGVHTRGPKESLLSWMKIDRILLSEGVVCFEKMLVTAWFVHWWLEFCRFSLARERQRPESVDWCDSADLISTFLPANLNFVSHLCRRKYSLIRRLLWFSTDRSRESVAICGKREEAKNHTK